MSRCNSYVSPPVCGRGSVDIFQRLATTQRAQSGTVQSHIFLYFGAVCQAYWRSAQPIAFWRKNSRDPSEGSMQAYNSFRSVSALNPSWHMIAVAPLPQIAGLAPGQHLAPIGVG